MATKTEQQPASPAGLPSTCTRCGATFGCAMREGAGAPCWCTQMPPVVAVPEDAVGCWCPACLAQHIAAQQAESEKVPQTRLK